MDSQKKLTDSSLGSQSVRWNLNDLYSGMSDTKIYQDMDGIQKKVDAFVSDYKGKLSNLSSDELNRMFQLYESILDVIERLNEYIFLLYSTDTSSEEIKKLRSILDNRTTAYSNQLLFVSLEIAKLSDEKIKYYQQSSECATYAYFIKHTWKTSRHLLSEKEEQVIQLKAMSGSTAFKNLYEELTSSFQFSMEVDGEVKKMNGNQLRALRYHPSSDVRQRAMKLFLERYNQHRVSFMHIFNGIVKDNDIERQLRNYPNSIYAMNLANDLHDEWVEVLHDTTELSYHLVQRFYQHKKKLLGLEEMTLADIYAPLSGEQSVFSWQQAKQLVLDAFEQFDSDFYIKAKLMFDENRIDAPVDTFKTDGAYCYSASPKLNPYVLLNFSGKARDVSTLAHELGHAIHAMYASKQTLLNTSAILPLAETASVFSEMILTHHLLNNTTDVNMKRRILVEKLEEIIATSHRQNVFSQFERKVHEHVCRQWVDWDDLGGLYESEVKKMFGDTVIFPVEYQYEWATIPHMFHSPFYVYSYNFANLLVLSLYQQYLEDREAFVPRLKEFLSLGSSKSPLEIARTVHADFRDPQFWKRGFVYIESLLDQLDALDPVE